MIKLDEQFFKSIINITIDTYQQIIDQLPPILEQLSTQMPQSLQSNTKFQSIIKSIFYGLWNFDKMINQHKLSTKIANILHEISDKTAKIFLIKFFSFLHANWSLIDHHRINKFMQLVRYLMRQCMNKYQNCVQEKNKKKKQVSVESKPLCNQVLNDVLWETTFKDSQKCNDLTGHILHIYFEVISEVTKNQLTYHHFAFFHEKLLKNISNENIRNKVIDKIYSTYRVQIKPQEKKEMLKDLLLLAKEEQKDQNRKSLYTLVAFMKDNTDYIDFQQFLSLRKQKRLEQRQKVGKKQKITKGKKKQVQQLKEKRKKKTKKQNKNKKVTSGKKFQIQHGLII